MGDSEIAALDRHSYFSLETFRRSGVGVKTPVWFAARDGCAYVFSEAKAGKVKRLRNDDRVRVAPCTVNGRISGNWLEGRAHVVDDSAIVARAYEALRAKYGWKMMLVDFASRLAGRFDGRAILRVELS